MCFLLTLRVFFGFLNALYNDFCVFHPPRRQVRVPVCQWLLICRGFATELTPIRIVIPQYVSRVWTPRRLLVDGNRPAPACHSRETSVQNGPVTTRIWIAAFYGTMRNRVIVTDR